MTVFGIQRALFIFAHLLFKIFKQ